MSVFHFLSSKSNTHDFPVLNFLQHSKRTDAPGNFRNLNEDRIRSVVNKFISERGRVRQFCVRAPTCPENRFSTVQITVQFNKLTSVFLCVCPLIDDKLRHNIVKVTGSAVNFDNVMTKFIINKRTHA